MRETADRMLTQIREWFSALPRIRKIQMGVLSVVIIVLAIVIISLMTRTNWVVLSGTGDAQSTAVIYGALEDMGIPNRVVNNRIEVPEERLGEVQMRLREQGLLGSTLFNTDLLDQATGFGITDNHARELYDRQTADEIRIAIIQVPKIQSALVILKSGDTSVFRVATNTKQASASVMLTLRPGERLTNADAQAIGEIVRTAIPGIEYQNITISDNDLNVFKPGDAGLDLDEVAEKRIVLRDKITEQLRDNIEVLLSPVYGLPNIQVQPNVKLNFDRVVQEKVEFDPPIPGEVEGILRSQEELYERSRGWRDAEGIPGTDSNNMGTVEYPFGPFDDRDDYFRHVLGSNWEINETRTMIEREQGVIESLSISVLINAEIEGVEGDYTEEVRDLVSKGIGVAPGNISVQHIPFTFVDTSLQEMFDAWEAEQAARRNRELFETILMYVVILLLGVMVMMLVRTVIKAVQPPPEPEPVLIAAGPDGIDFLVGDEDAEGKEFEDIDLHAKSPGLEQIERFIDKDSAAVAQLLKNWVSDE